MNGKRKKTKNERIMEIRFGEMVKRLRKQYGYTQNDLVEKTNLTTQTISNIENHGQDVGIDTIVLLAQAFSMTLKEFISNIEE